MPNRTTGFTIGPRNVKPIKGYPVESMDDIKEAEKLGIHFSPAAMKKYSEMGLAMDAEVLGPMTAASVSTPIQFLQGWLPGFVEVVTQARKIDEIIGFTSIGKWHDEEIVQGVSELSGKARLYSDYNNAPLADWNVNWERATVVRFEHGMQVTRLSEARAGEMNYNDADAKRRGSARSLEISRNMIGFYGFNDGSGRTYGFFNAPNQPAYVNVPAGAAGQTSWASKVTLEIIADILTAITALRVQSGDLIDPKRDSITMAVPTSAIDRLSTPTELGYSVLNWLNSNYPNIRVVSAPELQNANGGASAMILFVDKHAEESSDDGSTFVQMVPTKFMTLGVEQKSKGYKEDYSSATAGVLCKRPYLVYRASGI